MGLGEGSNNMKTENEEFVPTRISKMIESRTPFAVIQFFENLIFNSKEKHRKYEIMYVGEKKVIEKVGDKEVEVVKNILKFDKFTTDTDIDFAMQKDKFTLVKNNKHGKIWEFGKFNEYQKIMINEQQNEKEEEKKIK